MIQPFEASRGPSSLDVETRGKERGLQGLQGPKVGGRNPLSMPEDVRSPVGAPSFELKLGQKWVDIRLILRGQNSTIETSYIKTSHMNKITSHK